MVMVTRLFNTPANTPAPPPSRAHSPRTSPLSWLQRALTRAFPRQGEEDSSLPYDHNAGASEGSGVLGGYRAGSRSLGELDEEGAGVDVGVILNAGDSTTRRERTEAISSSGGRGREKAYTPHLCLGQWKTLQEAQLSKNALAGMGLCLFVGFLYLLPAILSSLPLSNFRPFSTVFSHFLPAIFSFPFFRGPHTNAMMPHLAHACTQISLSCSAARRAPPWSRSGSFSACV